jgi:hypothetical protein
MSFLSKFINSMKVIPTLAPLTRDDRAKERRQRDDEIERVHVHKIIDRSIFQYAALLLFYCNRDEWL